MKEDWYDILPTGKHKYPYRIQWSPTGHVRAKHNTETNWKMTTCSKACYAETLGYALLQGGEK